MKPEDIRMVALVAAAIIYGGKKGVVKPASVIAMAKKFESYLRDE